MAIPQKNIITEQTLPTRFDAAVFRLKTAILQTKRSFHDVLDSSIKKASIDKQLIHQPVIAESISELWTETEPEERFLIAGKIQNLRIAVRSLNGLEIAAGDVFSFWKQVGRAIRRRGFVKGRELREGCIIPNVGGGLCQISNALYDAALKANFEIVERHAHSQVIAGSLAETGRDATVFWNYIDLRFRADHAFRIEASLSSDKLTVRFRGSKTENSVEQKARRRILHADQPRSCATCGMDDCHSVVIDPHAANFGKTAFLVDDVWPEFNAYIERTHQPKDVLFIPLDGNRYRKPNYAWATNGFSRVEQSVVATLLRSYSSRRLASQGSARQLNLLATYEKLADSYARRLDHECLHVVVQQNILPYLWQKGHLGGRTFDVLMTATPMAQLQENLDRAASLNPESKTLGDFRADPELVNAETEALTNARKIITPHTAIAGLFGERSVLLNWSLPTISADKTFLTSPSSSPRIVFVASTVGRKGCYEFREAVRGLAVTIVTAGPLIEGNDFWHGFKSKPAGNDPLAGADLVVLPAYVEHKPRRLLRAAALGIPVIASNECGIGNVDGVTLVNSGDVTQLRSAIMERLNNLV